MTAQSGQGGAQRFVDRVAVVIGGAHGIGLATARRLAAEGATVVIADNNETHLANARAALAHYGHRVCTSQLDICDERQVIAATADTIDRFGQVDCLHVSAGVLIPGTATTLDLADWDRSYAVNVRGSLLACRAVLPHMIEQRRGSIVLTSSTSGLVGEPNQCAYNSSKAAVVNLARQLAVDYAAHGLRVNCVCPGWVDSTGFNEPVLDGLTAAEIDRIVRADVPLGRQGTPDEIAAAVCFLLADEASFITGHALCIDGGDSAS